MKHDNLIASAHRTINSISNTHKAVMDNAARVKFWSRLLPTGFARRVMMLLAILLVGGNASWGEETILWEGTGTSNNQVTISGSDINSKWPTVESSSTLRIYTEDKGLNNIQSNWGGAAILSDNSISIPSGSSCYNSDDLCYEIPLSDFVANFPFNLQLNNGEGIFLQVGAWDNQNISKVSVFTPSGPVDTFPNVAADPCATTSGSEQIARDLTTKTINLSGASLTGAKYARIYLADDKGKAVDPTGLLSVSYGSTPAVQAGTNVKNGVYVYDGGNNLTLSNVSITLNAGAGNFMKYQIVCLLANDISTATPNDGTTPLTQEPKWQKQYTYTFTYPVEERIVFVPAELNSSSELTEDYVALNYFTEALDFFEVSANDSYYNRAGGMNGNWFARWYVRHKDGTSQTLGSGLEQHATEWRGTIYRDYNDSQFKPQTGNGVHFSGTSVYNGSFLGGNNQQWAVASMLGFFKVYRPSSVADFSNYEVVFETTNECDSEDPAIKLRYIFKFIPPIIFEYDGEIADKTSIKQTLDARNSTSVTIDWTDSEKTTGAMTTTGALYGRFFVVDENGDAVDPTSDAHKLTVTGGTLCEKKNSGYYIYNNGEGITISTVTLSSTDAITKYQVKCWLATATTGVAFDDVITTKMTEEPDITNEYTYSFRKPAPTTNLIAKEMTWSKVSMMADASTTAPSTDWDTTWDELSLDQYVKWYVVDGSDVLQPLAIGSSRQDGTWTINPGSEFTVSSNIAAMTGQTSFTAAKWNGTWGKPTIYAPAGLNYDDVKNCKVICEVSEEGSATATPNVRYTFSLVKSFFGELKDGGTEGNETATVNQTSTSETVALGTALTKWGGSGAKYARVWLTDASGTMVDPTGKLSVDGMSTFDGHPEYGFYVSNNEGITLSDATLTLLVGQYDKYQVHVALSTETLSPTYEPDYDFLYTFGFKYPVPVKYKTLIYDPVTRKTKQTILFKNYYEVTADCNVGFNDLVEHGYVRWYLEKTNGTKIEMAGFEEAAGYTDDGINGRYRYKFGGLTYTNNDPVLDPVITLPEEVDYRDVRVVCVVTTKDEGLPDNEPTELQIKYIYSLRTVSDLPQSLVHYQGESYRFLMESGKSDQAADRNYITVAGDAGITEKTWDYENNDVSETNPGNVRQNVHQVDYDIYVKAGSSDLLMLPFKDFVGRLPGGDPDWGPGSDTEPTAYLRWYDWNTDAKSAYLTASGSDNKLTEKDWGHMAQMLDFKPTHKQVGVTFTAPESFTDEITIVCDVSRYTDGFDDSFTYLLHEPTLSMRYIFHIHPAREIATAIQSKAASLEAVETSMKAHNDTKLYEYNGKVVVSLNGDDNDGKNSKFSLRANLPAGLVKDGDDANVSELKYYWVFNGDNPVSCTQMQWYAYLDDGTTVWKKVVTMGEGDKYKTKRLGIYTVNDLSGSYTSLTDNTTTSDITIQAGSKLHLVGCIGDGTVEMPVIWTDLEFIDAAPKSYGNEPEERTEAYLEKEYNHANTLNFDDFFDVSKRTSKPTNSYENYAEVPIDFFDAQYGFCYPQLYGQDATNWWLRHRGGGWYGYGFAPLHADYTLLKSMNMQNISKTREGGDPTNAVNSQSMYTLWYDSHELYDITHAGDNSKYGTFLYVDAADEARTIASLEFDAALCANSEIYYTAYIADMTDAATKPQVMFRVYTYNTSDGRKPSTGTAERIPVVSFQTGDINSEGAVAGAWYQVHGYTDIPSALNSYINGNSRHFYVDIDNFSEDTNGADYCVDQISFYTSTAKVKVKQVGTVCDEGAGVEVKIVANAENLINSLRSYGDENGTYLYYRIFKRHEGASPLTENEALDGNGGVYEDNSNIDWRTIFVPRSYNEAELPDEDPATGQTLPAGQTTGYYKGRDGVVYFQFDDKLYPLEPDITYFVSFFTLGGNPSGSQVITNWGNPYGDNVCSVYSNDITPSLLRIDLTSNGVASDGNIGLGCGQNELQMTFDITVQYPTNDEEDPYAPYNGVTFDFYIGSKADFKAIKDAGETMTLEKALDHFRVNYPNFSGEGELPEAPKTTNGIEFTEAMRTLIQEHWDNGNGLLQLKASTQFDHTFKKEESGAIQFAAIPVTRHVDNDRYICSPLELNFNVDPSAGAPKIDLGFGDVDYPEDYKRVVRVGLEQLNKMKDGYKLHIPVSGYQNYGSEYKGKKLYFTNAKLTVVETNDPAFKTDDLGVKEVATVYDPDNDGQVYVSKDRMYLPLDFTNCEIAFHEGYYYEVSASFYDEEDPNVGTNPCVDDLYLVFKVVPEFVTWDAQETGNAVGEYSGNWYNDENWKRSVRSDLYKDSNGTSAQQNTATAAHPNGYDDNGEGSLEDLTSGSDPGFIPMKFTYVTMLGDNHSPSLFREEFNGAPKEPGSVQTGGQLISKDNEMRTDTSPSGGSSDPTSNLRYDMLVRYGSGSDGEGCKGHPKWNGGSSWTDGSTTGLDAQAFDVEKFYGNICKEIYFKPGAELRLQQRLTYEKAWVEKELVANKWYLMSAPLKGTFAGDMYVPTAITDYSLDTPAEVKGRQVTEAFQPINFDKSKGYSRTLYPIYQRSWGQTAKVYTKTDDIRATDYSAKLKFGSVSSNLVEWGHTYNDVQVPYTGYSGFAIRANKKDQTDNTLIRLPKADTQYDYYQWNNETASTGGVTQTVTKGSTVYGRLVYDNQGGGLMSDDLEQWSIPLANLQVQGMDEDGYTYYLVGNPFMASIDMGKFFGYLDGGSYYSYNPKLNPVYYTYEAGTVTAVDARTTAAVIRPLQAFIVKCKANDAPEGIVFNRWAITDGNYTPPTLYVPEGGSGTRAMNPTLTLRAANGNGSSEATVRIDASASSGYNAKEDVSTLFDSNLSDVPMVYTVAGSRAVSIDSRPDLDVVSFGVACASNDELVEVNVDCSKFTDNGLQFTDDNYLYIIDAVIGSMTEVGEGSSFAVQPNDYGRYFLTTNGDMTAIRETLVSEDIVVSVRNRQLTVRSASELKTLRVLDTNGMVVASLNDCGTETTINLALGGVYIIEAETEHGRKTRKVIVK